MKNISITILKAVISVVAVAALGARIIWPDLKIDAITFGLMILAILPWLAELIESAKFPGGWEVKFRDVQKAGEKVIAGHESAKPTSDEKNAFDTIAKRKSWGHPFLLVSVLLTCGLTIWQAPVFIRG